LKAEVGQLKEKSETLARQAQAQEIEAARARKDFEAIDHRANEKGQQLARLDERRAGMEKEIAGHRVKQQEGATVLAELAARAEQLEQDLLTIEQSASDRQHEVAEAGRLAHEIMLQLTGGTERARALKDRLQNSVAEAERLVKAAESRRAEMEHIAEELREADTRMAELRQQLDGYQKQKAELESQITFENQQKEVVQLDLRKLGERAQVLQRDFNEAQNELHEVELRRKEFLVQLDNIKVQSREKFSLHLNDVIRRVLMPETVIEEPEPPQAKVVDIPGEPTDDRAETDAAVQSQNEEEQEERDLIAEMEAAAHPQSQ
jgi:chromosome segregation ATPase